MTFKYYSKKIPHSPSVFAHLEFFRGRYQLWLSADDSQSEVLLKCEIIPPSSSLSRIDFVITAEIAVLKKKKKQVLISVWTPAIDILFPFLPCRCSTRWPTQQAQVRKLRFIRFLSRLVPMLLSEMSKRNRQDLILNPWLICQFYLPQTSTSGWVESQNWAHHPVLWLYGELTNCSGCFFFFNCCIWDSSQWP